MPRVEFGPISVSWEGDVLTPRPWTLAQSRWAAELAAGAPDGPVLELFAGVGHIGLAVAALTDRHVVQVELEEDTCRWTKRNAADNGLADRVELRCGDAAEVLQRHERFALVLADPPYIPSGEVDRFPDDPPVAIDGGEDGLDLVRLALEIGAEHLDDGGSLVLQVRGEDQAADIEAWLHDGGPRLHVAEVRVIDEDRALARLVHA